MQKLIRPTYPTEINVFILTIIFILSCFFSHQMFEIHWHNANDEKRAYLGMVLVGIAVICMVLIVWEEILFPVKVKEVEGGLVFRNHQSKLIIQVLLYCGIIITLTYIYLQYEVKHSHFFLWAAVCLIPPIIEKIISGINNYYDFLKLTDKIIEYKNNEKEGSFAIDDIKNIVTIQDDSRTINKLELVFITDNKVVIDLDEMELEAFYDSIHHFITTHYTQWLKETKALV